ncbi:MAG: DMT family transporter [Burkholderiaceae bacterium]|nr:DMT family transporter [Burkholderiaceae bacterium]
MSNALPVLSLVFNAFVWGVSWWPFRRLLEAGVHPLWATAFVYALVLGVLLVVRPGAVRSALQHPALWLLAVSSGLNNMAFNWAVTVGDVVRVVLLFYLMPAWSVLLAWKILGEHPTRMALLRLLMAFAGVVLVLLPPDAPASQLFANLSVADGLAVAGGLFFALTNVTLRRLKAVPDDARMLAMFVGCVAMAAVGAGVGVAAGIVPRPPAPALPWMLVAMGLAVAFLVGNYALQFGAARLAAGTTALVMLSEVVFASVSSVLLAGTVLHTRTLFGGGLIIVAALLATVQNRPTGTATTA